MLTIESEGVFDWQTALTQTYLTVFQNIQQVLPQLLLALLLLAVGVLTAYLLRMFVRRLIYGFDWFFNLAVRMDAEDRSQVRRSYANIAGLLVFWSVLLLFITAAAEVLGWSLFAGWLGGIIAYLPRLTAGLVIVLAAFLLGSFVRPAVMKAAGSMGFKNTELPGRTAQVVVILMSVVIGLQQLGINVGFLTTVLIVVTGVLLLGGVMAFAFGAKILVANIIGAQFAQKHCQVGEYMQIGEHCGEILEITQTAIILENKYGRTTIPAKLFNEKVSSFYDEGVSGDLLNNNSAQQED